MNFKVKPGKPLNAVMDMVVPGRRALGEDWRRITIRPTPEGKYTVENEEAEAPPDGRPIFVPGMGELSTEMTAFLVEGARKAQDYQSRQQKPMTEKEKSDLINRLWLEWCEQKLRWFKGQSVYGPGGFTQREVPERTHWSNVHE